MPNPRVQTALRAAAEPQRRYPDSVETGDGQMAHPDLDALLNPLLTFARQMLSKQGTFFPFGASMKSDGQIAMAAGQTGDERPDPVAVIELLVTGFQEQAATRVIRAAGVCIDMRVVPPGASEKTDAICAQLEHSEGQCVDVYLPYKKGWLGRFKFGEVFASPRDGRIFAKSASAG
jgi:hypothetical protein